MASTKKNADGTPMTDEYGTVVDQEVSLSSEGDAAAGEAVFDFSEIKAPEPLPRGHYILSIVAATAGQSKKGEPKLDLRLKVEEGEFANRNIFETLSFAPGALPFTKQALVAMGIPAAFRGSLAQMAEMLVGVTLRALVDINVSTAINPETGEAYPPRNRVKNWSRQVAGAGQL